ncbi:hypothetical protein PR003_g31924 [Phytophthora rubi]|uniref:Restriction endonuclease domain-containing protein n=1 Tax=Phytophthora rubi TaxID=129364 RepID=A0A6A4B0S6_9STRA|nr:hypothetical protein PR003_g31924 [Phytophthora rubi]
MSVAVGGDSWSTEALSLPMRSSGVRRINNAVRGLDWALVENVLNPPDGSDGAPFELCVATRDDWNRYVQSEHQALGSRWVAWWDDRVFIVELPVSPLHEDLVGGIRRAITDATGTGRTHLADNGAPNIGNRATLPDDINARIAFLLPDESFGPVEDLPGAVLPPGFSWPIFHTLKVEIGVSQGWGPPIQQQGQAGHGTSNEKADPWRQCPGVEYVLSIHVSQGVEVREYRLDSIVGGQFAVPNMPHADIDNNTVVQFDARRLLGIPPGGNLPVGFNDPVQFNLFDVVDPIIQRRRRAIRLERAIRAQVVAAAAADDDGQPPRRRQRRH